MKNSSISDGIWEFILKNVVSFNNLFLFFLLFSIDNYFCKQGFTRAFLYLNSESQSNGGVWYETILPYAQWCIPSSIPSSVPSRVPSSAQCKWSCNGFIDWLADDCLLNRSHNGSDEWSGAVDHARWLVRNWSWHMVDESTNFGDWWHGNWSQHWCGLVCPWVCVQATGSSDAQSNECRQNNLKIKK